MHQLPYDKTVEQAYLSSLLLGGEIDPTIIPDDFYFRGHQEVYEAILTLARSGEKIDIALLSGIKRFADEGRTALIELTNADGYPSLSNSYAKRVRAFADRRNAIKTLVEAADKAANDEVVLSEFIEETESKLNRIVSVFDRKSNNTVSLENVFNVDRIFDSYKDHIEKLIQGGLLVTGYPILDKVFRGVARGEVMTIIARSGSFKTAFLQHLLRTHADKDNGLAVFFSLEMPVHSVGERYLQAVLKNTCGEIEAAFRADPEVAKYMMETAREYLKNIIVVRSRPNLQQMERFVDLIERKFMRKVSVVGIDYLGLVSSNSDNEYQHISSVAVETKILAGNLNVPVILLAQTSRKGGDGKARITLDMGRGSGQIEEAADFVFGLWKHEDEAGKKLILSILKNRKGEVGKDFWLHMKPDFMLFDGCEPWEEPRAARVDNSDDFI
jgi:replicative DNA helicase